MPRYSKSVIFILCLLPLFSIVWDGATGGLGANPVEKVTHRTGDWALRILLLTMAITPLRILSGRKSLVRFRRMLGLFCFFYAFLHFSIYLVFDHFFNLADIIKDIVKRPYITVGFAAFVLLIPLAVTSTNSMQRKLGKRWKQLHQLVYFVALFGILHYLWQAKADLVQPLLHAAILLILLVIRAWHQRRSVGGIVRETES